jgi:Rieske Fe-S protein
MKTSIALIGFMGTGKTVVGKILAEKLGKEFVEVDALILGIDVQRVKVAVYVVASLVTGAVVSVSGPIAYIGLICPHLGCVVEMDDSGFTCPCHGSKFNADGSLKKAPPPNPCAPCAWRSLRKDTLS